MRGALYIEINPFACEWLRVLILFGHIAPGDVYEGSIEDVEPDLLRRYAQVHAFAGIGVWSLALRDAGWPDDRPVWTASCPCQPFSAAGKAAGFADERHLWPALDWLIGECKPGVVLGEQVASPDGLRWFDLVSTDLEGKGYAVAAHDLCAAGVGAPHKRQRLYFMAHTDNTKWRPEKSRRHVCNRTPTRRQESNRDTWECLQGQGWLGYARKFSSDADGDPTRVGRLRGYGNAIVKDVAQIFIEEAMKCLP